MIQRLLTEIVTRLQSELDGSLNGDGDINDHIDILYGLPDSDDLPFIALQPDALEVNTKVRDTLSSEVRPQQIVQEEAVDSQNTATSYTLDQIPLENSVLCYVIYNQGDVLERSKLLVQGKDYIVSFTENGIEVNFSFERKGKTYTYDLSGVSHIKFQYRYAAVFTVREFRQNFFINIYTNPLIDAEQWAALVTTIILTNYDELIDATKEFQDVNSPYVAKRAINQLLWTGSMPDTSVSPGRIQLVFEVQGQLMAIKTELGDFGILNKIRHSGVSDTDLPIDINAQRG